MLLREVDNIGRGMKVNKEEIFGMYVALEKYINTGS